jgi:oxygen-dependent protoporphyrinogen oxidase
VDGTLAAALGEITYASSVVINLAFRSEQVAHRLDGFGFVVPAIEKRQLLAGSFSSVKYAGRAPDGHVLIRAFLGGAMNPKLIDADDHDLRWIALKELDDLLGITGEPLFYDIARWRRSMPQYTLGHLQRVQEIERRIALHSGVALAGSAFRGVGIPQCIHSGERAAERALTVV